MQSNSPSKASLNALGAFLLVSLSFVMVTMIEFAIVLLISRRYRDDKKNISNGPLFEKPTSAGYNTNLQRPRNFELDGNHMRYVNSYSCTEKIDLASLFIFSISYFVFNCVYFAYFMN